MACSFHKFYERWILTSAIIHCIGMTCTLLLGSPIIWTAFIILLFGIYLFKIIEHLPRLPLLYGYANWVSILRLLIIIAAFSLQSFLSDLYLFVAFLSAIILDGVDGFLARKFHHETRQGAILDMEIDALMVFLMASIHIINSRIPFWILLPAGFRYVYAWLLFLCPLNTEKEFLPKIVRATIAVIFFLALLVPFVLNAQITDTIVAVAGILILISFGSSYVFATIYLKSK